MQGLFHRLLAAASGGALVLASLIGLAANPSGAAATKSPVNIGVICSCTGPLASSVQVGPPAFQAWAKWQNTQGGLNGHPINVIVMDDQTSSSTALQDVTSMVTNDHITILVDDSNADAAFSTYIDQQHIPVIGGGSQSNLLLTDPNFFAPGQTVDDYFPNYMLAAKKVHASTISQFYCAESPICQQGVASFKAQAHFFNIKLGPVVSISFAAPNYTAECLSAKQAGVQILNVADAVTVVQHVAKDCLAQGYQPWQLALDGGVSLSFTTSPGIENKFIGSEPDIPFFNKTIPGMTIYNNALKKYAAAQTINNPNYNEEATQNWVTGLLITQVVKNAKAGTHGDITTDQIYNGLFTIKNNTLGGMAPPLTFHKGVPNPVDCWFWISIKNHQFTTPYGTSAVCAKPKTS